MILIDVYVNSIDKHYDMFVDKNSTVEGIITDIVDMVYRIENTSLPGNIEEMLLCNIDSGMIMRSSKILVEYGVQNGSKLLLV